MPLMKIRVHALAAVVLVVLAGAIVPPGVRAQSATLPAASRAFDAASVRPSNGSAQGRVNLGIQVDGSQVHIVGLQLRDLLRLAYNVKPYQIVGPKELDGSRFDVAATLPAGATPEQVPQMLQSMLASRFDLKVHRDMHEFSVYALVQEDGGRFHLKPTVAAAELPDPRRALANLAANGSEQGVALNLGNGSGYSFANNQFQVTRLSMAVFAYSLSRFMDRPVIDATGLKDGYDFTLALTPEDYRLMLIRAAVNSGVLLPPQALALLEGASPASLYTSLHNIGLKLVSREAPLERIVVDHVSAVPAPN